LSILEDFHERQQQDNMLINKIGDIFLKHIPNLSPYLKYCSNQSRSLQFFETKMKGDPKFNAKIKVLSFLLSFFLFENT